jgi:hypothetical protein
MSASRTNWLTGFLFIILLLTRSSSASFLLRCCVPSNDSDLDCEVHDPAEKKDCEVSSLADDKNDEELSLISIEELVQAPPPSPENSPNLKSILKSSKSSMESRSSSSSARVVFSSDTKIATIFTEQFPEDFSIRRLIKAKHSKLPNRALLASEIIPIFETRPFDYEVDSMCTLEESSVNRDLYDILKVFYPGLLDVPMRRNDFFGLALFATFHAQSSSFFRSGLKSFFVEFISDFPDSSKILDQFTLYLSQMNRGVAFKILFKLAYENNMYYTIEAFYLTYAIDFPLNFLELSVEFGDKKSSSIKFFKRFLELNPDIDNDTLMFWSLKYGNVPVFLNCLKYEFDIQEVQHLFKQPIIVHVSKLKNTHFPGLLDILYPIEFGYFDIGLMSAIDCSNFFLFRDMINFSDNADLYPSLDSALFHQLKLLINKHVSLEDLLNVDYGENHLTESLKVLCALNSDDTMILQSFDTIINDPDSHSILDITELFMLSLFLNSMEYLKIITSCSKDLAFKFKIHEYSIGIWVLITPLAKYDVIMHWIVRSPSFDYMHAIANPDFPAHLWQSVYLSDMFVSDETYQSLAERFAFHSDYLYDEDLDNLGLKNRQNWNLIELAVLNFNVGAVKTLVFLHSDQRECIASGLELAAKVCDLIGSEEYAKSHLMPLSVEISTENGNHLQKYPKMYRSEGIVIETSDTILRKLRNSINSILMELQYEIRH